MTLAVYTHLTKFKEDEAISSLNTHLDKVVTLTPQTTRLEASKPSKIRKKEDL